MRRRAALARLCRGGAAALALLAATGTPAQGASGTPDPPPAPLIAAASDLKFALDEVIEQFSRDSGRSVRVTYGSSGNFARQIAQGAPYELFLSADEQFVEALAARGLTRGRGELYGVGRIVVFAPEGSPLRPDARLEHLASRLADGTAGRLAIASPEHAPYGRAAEQVLRSLGLWEEARPRLVLGENVAQAAQFAVSGNADGGLIAHSLALAPELLRRGSFALIPEALHEPLRQRMVLLTGASPAAELFYDYLRSPAARAILARYGFTLPGD